MSGQRIQLLNRQAVNNDGKYVLWLTRTLRSRSSPTYSHASKQANQAGRPLLAAYLYYPERHNLAQRVFLFEGLQNLETNLRKLGTPLVVLKVADDTEALDLATKLAERACEVITDAGYLREDRGFDEKLKDLLITNRRRLTRVEGNVIIPVTVVSSEAAKNARLIRQNAWHYMDEILAENWPDVSQVPAKKFKSLLSSDLPIMNISETYQKVCKECDTQSELTGGEDSAEDVLEKFLTEKLCLYDKNRNIPAGGNQSFLSAYIHYGMINPVEIVIKVQQTDAPKDAKDAFLEELVVRRELAHNFVYYYRDTYDTFDCLPDWAKKTMSEHKGDERKFIYSTSDLEEGRTHDIYWNAAQFELIYTHKMLGYLRMYWAKKVIEWTPTYEEAYAFLIEQNNKYELDGHDPCGYSGVLWNFGMHDRAHANRPVIGKIRYMCAEGLKRKFGASLQKYVRINYDRAGRELEEFDEPTRKRKKRAADGPTKKRKKRAV